MPATHCSFLPFYVSYRKRKEAHQKQCQYVYGGTGPNTPNGSPTHTPPLTHRTNTHMTERGGKEQQETRPAETEGKKQNQASHSITQIIIGNHTPYTRPPPASQPPPHPRRKSLPHQDHSDHRNDSSGGAAVD